MSSLPTPEETPESPSPASVEVRRRVRLSYGLWCLWLLGFGGLHRIYNRKFRTGLLWLFTFGLCGIGQLIDLLLIPAMAAQADGQGPKRLEGEARGSEEGAPDSEEATPGSEPATRGASDAVRDGNQASRKSAEASTVPADPSPGPVPGSALPEAPSPAPKPPDTDLSPPLDLLRERRLELDLKPMSGLYVLRPALIRRGLLIGGVALGASVGLCAILLVVQQLLRAREAQLAGYEQQATQLRESIAIQKTGVKALQGANEQFVNRLSNVRSSSALLADLQLRVPEGVQLTKVQMLSATEMRLEGQARDPVGFGRVNAMELVLRRSPLFLATGVLIEKAERVPEKLFEVTPGPGGKPGGQALKLQLPSAVNFVMKATLSPLEPKRLVAVMEALEARGMALRLELLQREGLLK